MPGVVPRNHPTVGCRPPRTSIPNPVDTFQADRIAMVTIAKTLCLAKQFRNRTLTIPRHRAGAMDLTSDGLFESLAAHLEFELGKRLGISPATAQEIALAVGETVRAAWAGQALYIPYGVSKRWANRDQDIFAEFNGRNYQELSLKHGISVMRVRQVITRQLELHRKRQPGGQAASGGKRAGTGSDHPA